MITASARLRHVCRSISCVDKRHHMIAGNAITISTFHLPGILSRLHLLSACPFLASPVLAVLLWCLFGGRTRIGNSFAGSSISCDRARVASGCICCRNQAPLPSPEHEAAAAGARMSLRTCVCEREMFQIFSTRSRNLCSSLAAPRCKP